MCSNWIVVCPIDDGYVKKMVVPEDQMFIRKDGKWLEKPNKEL